MELLAVMQDVEKMRASRPLIVNLTNYVVANTTANALLALGASPAMSYWAEDAGELTAFASALVVNIGTPTPEFVDTMFAAGKMALEKKIPTVLDPVATGVTKVRSDAASRFLEECRPSVVRGNASEIMAMAGIAAVAKGVDSTAAANDAVEAAQRLAASSHCVVSVSGPSDYITDGTRTFKVTGGHEMMSLVTGLGCTATALTGAFLAVTDPLIAATEAMIVMSAAGGKAKAQSQGPGSLQFHFYDALYGLSPAELENYVCLEEI